MEPSETTEQNCQLNWLAAGLNWKNQLKQEIADTIKIRGIIRGNDIMLISIIM